MPEFKIYYKKGEDPISLSYPEDTLIEDIFKDFSGKVNKDLKDLVFYYKGSQIKYGNSEKINLFLKQEIKILIFLLYLLPQYFLQK